MVVVVVVVVTEEGTQEVDREATLQRGDQGGRTLTHRRGVDPTLVPDLGPILIPKTLPDPVLLLEIGLHLPQTMETLRGADRPPDHLLVTGPHLLLLGMEVQAVQGPLNLSED